jgi:hypothetical protein
MTSDVSPLHKATTECLGSPLETYNRIVSSWRKLPFMALWQLVKIVLHTIGTLRNKSGRCSDIGFCAFFILALPHSNRTGGPLQHDALFDLIDRQP